MEALRFSPRAAFLSLAVFLVLSLLLLFPHSPAAVLWLRQEGGLLTTPRPNHDAIREYERNLPQHNLDLPFPEGRTGRYVRFNIQPKGQGWNNIMNEWYACT